MSNWACLDANNTVVNLIVADNEDIALACSWASRVIEYTVENAPNVGWIYLENGQWEDPTPPPVIPEPIPI